MDKCSNTTTQKEWIDYWNDYGDRLNNYKRIAVWDDNNQINIRLPLNIAGYLKINRKIGILSIVMDINHAQELRNEITKAIAPSID